MADKLSGYTGSGHLAWNYMKEKWNNIKEKKHLNTNEFKEKTREKASNFRDTTINYLNHGEDETDYSHIYRKKTHCELVRISAAVMGIEFCYAAETAFGSPTMLKIGIHHSQMTLIWCLSPFVGFFLTPILGSLSDRCQSSLGRRRPFIILLSLGTIIGLLLVPNGKALGIALGDNWNETPTAVSDYGFSNTEGNFSTSAAMNFSDELRNASALNDDVPSGANLHDKAAFHPWTVFFTILGMMTLDFSADACQSPSRAYLLDITIPEDHAAGLSTFTVLAGLGGSIGYAMGAVDWDKNIIGTIFGGQLRALFTLVTFIFIGCVFCTLFSFREIPLRILHKQDLLAKKKSEERQSLKDSSSTSYGAIPMLEHQQRPKDMPLSNGLQVDSMKPGSSNPFKRGEQRTEEHQSSEHETSFNKIETEVVPPSTEAEDLESNVTLKQYLLSIIYMPNSLRVLCLTNLFCWMSLVCYSLNFTDFVGEAVFGGDYEAPENSPNMILFEEGIRFGCWGMAIYSLSCSAYSFIIEKLVKRFGARLVYICGPLIYSAGMLLLALIRTKAMVLLLSSTAGIMYSTLFTLPYIIIAHYHATGMFSPENSSKENEPSVRGLGTDVAIVSSMVFLAQFILSATIGAIIDAVQSTVAVIYAASILSFCAAVSASFITYQDL